MINFNNLMKKDELELLLTEQELGTLELQYIVSQHRGMGEDPLLRTCVKLLYRNQMLEEENKILRNQKANIIEFIKSKNGYDKLDYYKAILKMLGEDNYE